MAYNKFKKLSQLRNDFGINDRIAAWLPKNLAQIQPSQRLLDKLEDATFEALGTEKAKSEYVIAPILTELRRQNLMQFSSFSGYEFNVDKTLGLSGFCDFILSAGHQRTEIEAPIFCLVEAKNDNIEKGIAQCGAEMYAAHLYNTQHNIAQKAVYGCVTNAFSWCFVKLEDKILYIDPNYVPLTFQEPNRVLSVLQWVLDDCLKNISK